MQNLNDFPPRIRVVERKNFAVSIAVAYFFALQTSIFESFEIQAVNHSIIGFTIPLDATERALRSLAEATDVTVKLSKRQGLPVLMFGGNLHQVRAFVLYF